jgi:transcriptional regulator with XRE-family HTH domain
MGETSTPQTIVAFMLEQQGMTRADLAPILGGRSRVSEFFSRKRRLSVPQIQKIRDVLHIPADLLMDSPRPAKKRNRRQGRDARGQSGATRSRGRRKA